MKEKLQIRTKALLKNRIFFVLSYLIAFPQTEKEKSNFCRLSLLSATLQSFRKLCEDYTGSNITIDKIHVLVLKHTTF